MNPPRPSSIVATVDANVHSTENDPWRLLFVELNDERAAELLNLIDEVRQLSFAKGRSEVEVAMDPPFPVVAARPLEDDWLDEPYWKGYTNSDAISDGRPFLTRLPPSELSAHNQDRAEEMRLLLSDRYDGVSWRLPAAPAGNQVASMALSRGDLLRARLFLSPENEVGEVLEELARTFPPAAIEILEDGLRFNGNKSPVFDLSGHAAFSKETIATMLSHAEHEVRQRAIVLLERLGLSQPGPEHQLTSHRPSR